MSIPLKSRNHSNFSAPNKCRFLFKPIIFVYSCKQSESLQHDLFTIHNTSEMAAYFNFKNDEISKELLLNKFNMILENQRRLLNDQEIPLPNKPQTSPRSGGVLLKKLFLKSPQTSQENTCVGVSFRPATLSKRDSNTGAFL